MKIGIIGAGQVGATAAISIMQKDLADSIVLVDVIEGLPQGKSLDMLESGPIVGSDVMIEGSNDLSDLKGSDIVIMTAGLPRKPGMSRTDLLKLNLDIVKPTSESVMEYAPDSILIIVTNPLDIMTYAAQKVSKIPPNRVFGMAGVLDAARYRTFLAMELNVSVEDVSAMLMGGHGDSMVPLPRYSTVSGIPVTEFLGQEKIEAIVDRTRNGGGEIVSLLKTGSAYYAPGSSIAQMVESVVRDKRRVLPACAHLTGEYGFNNIYAGVPVILGRNGVEKVLELELTDDEMTLFHKSVEEISGTVKEIEEQGLL